MNIPRVAWFGLVFLGLSLPLVVSGETGAHDHHDHHHHDDPHGSYKHDSDVFGGSLREQWFEPWVHHHFAPGGAPYVHNFGFEPAFLGRDVLATYGWSDLAEGHEQELELELEWAFTRRIGMVIEQAYVWEDPDGEPSVSGFGDLAIVPRIVLCEHDRFLLSANLEIELPTGSDDLGAGQEWHLAPFITTWADLGHWWTLTSAIGLEFALDSDETEFFFAAGLAKSFRVTGDDHGKRATETVAHSHELPSGILSLIAELYGETVLKGEPGEEDNWIFEALVGASYSLLPGCDIRAGYAFPISNDSELDGGVRFGAIWHF